MKYLPSCIAMKGEWGNDEDVCVLVETFSMRVAKLWNVSEHTKARFICFTSHALHLARTSPHTHFTDHSLHLTHTLHLTRTSSNTHFISLKRTSLKLSLAPINTNTHQPHTCIHDQLVLVHRMCKQIMFRPNNRVCLHPQLIECIQDVFVGK